MQVTFWGVRGSLPVPGPSTVKYGGNTLCLEIRDNSGTLIIIDAGTGIVNLGRKLLKEFNNKPIKGYFLLSHTHWDHIQGFPFFIPAFIDGNKFSMYGIKNGTMNLGKALKGQMRYQYFPVKFDALPSRPDFNEIPPGKEFVLKPKEGSNDIHVKTASLNHPGGGLAYRISSAGKSIVHICDTEQFDGALNQELIDFSKNADVLIHDSMYTPEDIASGRFKGYGHSSWLETLKVAEAAEVKIPVFIHYKPEMTDEELDEIEKKAKKINPNAISAKEGLTLTI